MKSSHIYQKWICCFHHKVTAYVQVKESPCISQVVYISEIKQPFQTTSQSKTPTELCRDLSVSREQNCNFLQSAGYQKKESSLTHEANANIKRWICINGISWVFSVLLFTQGVWGWSSAAAWIFMPTPFYLIASLKCKTVNLHSLKAGVLLCRFVSLSGHSSSSSREHVEGRTWSRDACFWCSLGRSF